MYVSMYNNFTYKGTDTECEKLTKMSTFFTVLMVIFVQLEIPG